VVVVTHDRSLMARLATRILEVDHGRVIPYPGGYDDYESARLARAAEERAGGSVATVKEKPSPSGGSVVAAVRPQRTAAPKPAARAGESREQRASRQKHEKELARVEKDIETRETRVKVLEAQLADPTVYSDPSRSKELVGEYDRLRTELESLWQKLEMLG
jgi:ATPase subunit of ABC transporter with duplicated ATPase domains